MQHPNWQCPKCDSMQFETHEMRAEGGILSSIFDVSTNKFSALTCSRCTSTELYRTRASGMGKVLDFLAT